LSAIIGDFDMTTDILPPERWAMDPGAYSGLVSAYADTISCIGYTADTTNRLVAAARHLCAWAHLTGRALEGAADDLWQDFAGHDCHCGGVRRGGPRSACYIFRVERFVRFLVAESVLTSALIGDPHAGFVAPYLDWLRHHRGLSEITVRSNAKGLRQLLPVIGTDPSGWTPTTLRNAILDRRGREGRGGLKRTVTVLRSWLCYSAAMGRCDPGLVAAVPTIADWKGHHLPRGLKPADVDRLLAACDPSTPTGRRDRAILLLLVRLGLRAEDVRSLRFEQIDWTRGQIALAGKGRRTCRLPLPQEVGDALLAWLEDGRPQVDDPHVFLRYAPPWRPFTESAAISKIVRRSIGRAGLVDVPSRGAHLLRHSAARALLEDGASLETIGTMLRHRSIETTATYVKVDLDALGTIAQAWPEVAPC
jgi:site-specific recombinase XerD